MEIIIILMGLVNGIMGGGEAYPTTVVEPTVTSVVEAHDGSLSSYVG